MQRSRPSPSQEKQNNSLKPLLTAVLNPQSSPILRSNRRLPIPINIIRIPIMRLQRQHPTLQTRHLLHKRGEFRLLRVVRQRGLEVVYALSGSRTGAHAQP